MRIRVDWSINTNELARPELFGSIFSIQNLSSSIHRRGCPSADHKACFAIFHDARCSFPIPPTHRISHLVHGIVQLAHGILPLIHRILRLGLQTSDADSLWAFNTVFVVELVLGKLNWW